MDKEKQILNQLRLNPFSSQQELANKVGLSRPAVANYITNLTRRGLIKGRAYILQEESSIVCIGGANIDRKARTSQKVRLYSSNPVIVTEVCGGVARNFAENLSRLGISTSLITCVADDKEGSWLLNETKSQGVDVSQVWVFPTERTGTYTNLLDTTGKSVVSMADMNIYDQLKPEVLEEKWSQIIAAKAVLLDTNLPEESIEYMIKRLKDQKTPIFIDPVSPAKVRKLPRCLEGVVLLNPTKAEAEVLSEMTIATIDDCQEACERIVKRGVQNVIITLEGEGIYYFSGKESGHLSLYQTDVVDDTANKYVFASCVIYELMNDEPLLNACKFGLAGFYLTLKTEKTNSSYLKPEKIHEIVKEFS
ncbi:carbohydrate kinase [Virgibacillus necropolis]|uniref:Sugar kinase n=1 Tax=Virgibacillus necropolis TaxID=163877 RepID=A0A221MFH9_9BACI|nr:carbohydrate kinase [Virgibacillus necropolis]ASN06329.1 sugar kinase [Virgibacillus necropolis]